MVLADEINRTPPKTQAALLEAMQEQQVTVGGHDRTRCPSRSSSWPRRTRSSRKGRTRCPRPSSTASCSSCQSSPTRPPRRSWRSLRPRHDAGLDPHDVICVGGARRWPDAADLGRGAGSRSSALRVEAAGAGLRVSAGAGQRESPSVSARRLAAGATALLRHASKAWAWLPVGLRDARRGEGGGQAGHASPRPARGPELELEGAPTDGVLDGILGDLPCRVDGPDGPAGRACRAGVRRGARDPAPSPVRPRCRRRRVRCSPVSPMQCWPPTRAASAWSGSSLPRSRSGRVGAIFSGGSRTPCRVGSVLAIADELAPSTPGERSRWRGRYYGELKALKSC